MYLSVPVLAVSSGGPKETIKHEKTGFLEPAEPERWANAMEAVIDDPEYVQNMGKAGNLNFF
jgi:alpha-1,3/alpha-1,6-mannosyltransferase